MRTREVINFHSWSWLAEAPLTEKLQVAIFDDRPIFREALAALVSKDARFTLAGTVADCRGVEEILDRGHIDVVLLNIPAAFDEIHYLADRDIPVVKLSSITSSIHAKHILRAGARGFVNKSSGTQVLLDALAAVATGNYFIDPVDRETAEAIAFIDKAAALPPDRGPSNLTLRETTVLQMLATGHSTKEIARKLSIGPKSVATYKRRGFQKLNLNSKAQLFRFASGCGWLAQRLR